MSSGSLPTRGNATIGRILSIVGLLLLPVAFSVVSVALEAVSIGLGATGCMLGSRRLGTATVVLAVVVMLVSFLTQQ